MSIVGVSAVASIAAVLRTLVVCLCGFFLARCRANAGGAGTWRDLARLNPEFLTPCLVIAKFTSGIDPQSLRVLWPIVVLGLVLPNLWLGIGALGARLLLPSDQQQFIRFAAVSTAYPNAFAIPYPLMLALVRQLDWPTEHEDMSGFSASVTMLFSLVMLLQIWTVAFTLYGQAAKQQSAASSSCSHSADAEQADSQVSRGDDSRDPPSLASPEIASHTLDSGKEDVRSSAASSTDGGVGKSSSFRSFGSESILLNNGATRACQQIVNPLLISLFVAMGIALSPWREAFVSSAVHETVDFVGAASVPLVLVQLGAGMARPPAMENNAASLRWRSALTIVFLRLIVANAVGSCVVTGFRWMGWLQDRYTCLIAYLMCCSPTAANVGLVSSVQQAYIQPTAVLLFVMQLAAIPVMMISIAAYVASLA